MGQEGISEPTYEAYLASLLGGDRRRCRDLLTRLLDGGLPVRVAYLDLLQRALYRVGLLWERNRISVATEHVATAVTEDLLNVALPYLRCAPPVGRLAVVAGVSPEQHRVGAKMVADTFDQHGWDSVYVGASTPPGELLRLVRELRPDTVALSLTMFFNLGPLEAMIGSLRSAFPDQEIVVGGQGLDRLGPALAARARVTHLRTLAELDNHLAS